MQSSRDKLHKNHDEKNKAPPVPAIDTNNSSSSLIHSVTSKSPSNSKLSPSSSTRKTTPNHNPYEHEEREQENAPPTSKPKKELTDLDVMNYGARMVSDWPRFDGLSAMAPYYWIKRNDDPKNAVLYNTDLAAGGFFGNIAGIVTGYIAHKTFKYNNWYRAPGRDPIYRTAKTMAAVFTQAGTTFTMWFLDDSDPTKKFMVPVYGGAAGLAFGALAPLYAMYKWRRKVDPDAPDPLCDTNGEGPSKYLKTSFVLGTSLGPAAAAVVYHYDKLNLSQNMLSIWTGVAGVGAFFLGAIIVPLVNLTGRLFGHKGNILSANEKKDAEGNSIIGNNGKPVKEDGIRNNFIRSGVTFGTAAGILVAAILALQQISILGASFIDMAFFGGAGSIVFGVLLGIAGPRIDTFLKKRWNIEETKNSWDYVCRSTSFSGTAVGTIISLLFYSMSSMTMGMGIGGVVGWVAGLIAVWLPRKFRPEEKEPTTLPWTQRTGTGGIIGNILGTGVGLLVGLSTGPLAPIAVPLFAAIGSVAGNVIGALYGKELRTVIKVMFGMKEKSDEQSQPSSRRGSISRSTSDIQQRLSVSRASTASTENPPASTPRTGSASPVEQPPTPRGEATAAPMPQISVPPSVPTAANAVSPGSAKVLPHLSVVAVKQSSPTNSPSISPAQASHGGPSLVRVTA